MNTNSPKPDSSQRLPLKHERRRTAEDVSRVIQNPPIREEQLSDEQRKENPIIDATYNPNLMYLAGELRKMWGGAKDEYRAWLYRDSMWAVEALASKLPKPDWLIFAADDGEKR